MDESQVFEMTKVEVLNSLNDILNHLKSISFIDFLDDTSLDDFNEFLNLTDEGKVDMIIDYLKSESWQREEAVFDIARERIII